MANLVEANQFDAGIYQLETGDPVLGGAGGIANAQAQALANRTNWLKANMAPLASPQFTGNPLAPTPAQFGNDTSVATTEFVKRHGVEFTTAQVVPASIGLAAADAGKFLWLSGNGGVATLPALNSVPLGAQFDFFASLPNTVQRAGADTIYVNGGTVNSLPMGAGETLRIVATGIGWVAAGGASQLGQSAVFGASLSSNGYQKLPSGLIVQWGISGGVTNGSALGVTLPITFPNSFASVICSYNGTSPAVGNPNSINITSTSTFGIYNGGTTTATYRWMAIGY